MKKQKMGRNYLVDVEKGTITILTPVCAGRVSQHASDTVTARRNAERRVALIERVTRMFGAVTYGWEIVEGY